MALARDPMHALGPGGDAALFAGVALEQREVELAAFELALQIEALVGAHIEPQLWMRARKCAEQLCQPIGGEILGETEPNCALMAGLSHHVARFLG